MSATITDMSANQSTISSHAVEAGAALDAQVRRALILEELATHRVVRIAELSERFGVSEVSIRRDLERLEQSGLLKRIHGGAVSIPGLPSPEMTSARALAHAREKERIGRAAAQMIRENERLIFDSGTTTLQVARHIPGHLLTSGNLTVITASLPIVYELGAWKNVHIIVLGGVYLHEYQVMVGPQTIEALRGLHADTMFLGADGLTFSNGVTTANVLEAEVDRALVRSASRIVVVADSSKIGVIGLVTIMPLTKINALITDDKAPPDFVAQLRDAGVEVITV
ncbi:MAG: DeoR/GlpR family DNA-binding transcription regulator [Anaerolineae bacterium]|nr:DeoR/GlpR family DNA-binding transcription regulator [Anaerolineae bacterium]MDW8071168.1 DeoR/GlpR family DNA-binding transcription regulator [Anaerolineae bacterium]